LAKLGEMVYSLILLKNQNKTDGKDEFYFKL